MSKSKQKGTALETLIAQEQQANGFPVDRLPLKGANDVGDLTFLYDSVQEIKNWDHIELGVWYKELEAEMQRAGLDRGWIIHKRRGKGQAKDQWVTMVHDSLMSLMKEIRDLKAEIQLLKEIR